MAVTEKTRAKKTYSFTLNEEQMEEFKNKNPDLNLSKLIDDLIKEESDRQRRKKTYPFADLGSDFGITFNTPEEEAEFDKLTGLDVLEKQWEEYNKEK